VEDHVRVALVLRQVGRDGVRHEPQLVAEVVVLSRPDEQPVAARRLPPEGRLRPLERVAAVVGVDAGEEVLDAEVDEHLREAPRVAVDIRGHRAANRRADRLAVRDGPPGDRSQQVLVGELVEVRPGGRQPDPALPDERGELLLLRRRRRLEEALHRPEGLRDPAEGRVRGRERHRLAQEVRVPAADPGLRLGVADVRVGVVEDE
jgi:hypothetical protein